MPSFDETPHTMAEAEYGEKEKQPTNSVAEAGMTEIQEDRNGQFHRSFTPRQVHVSQTSNPQIMPPISLNTT